MDEVLAQGGLPDDYRSDERLTRGLMTERIIDWLSRELKQAQDEMGKVSIECAQEIAEKACNRTIRAMGGL